MVARVAELAEVTTGPRRRDFRVLRTGGLMEPTNEIGYYRLAELPHQLFVTGEKGVRLGGCKKCNR